MYTVKKLTSVSWRFNIYARHENIFFFFQDYIRQSFISLSGLDLVAIMYWTRRSEKVVDYRLDLLAQFLLMRWKNVCMKRGWRV